MAKFYRLIFNDHDREDAERQTASLAGLAVTLLVLVVSVFLTHQLQTKSAIENCLLAGRNNCDILVPRLR
jgi:hypothetical protein